MLAVPVVHAQQRSDPATVILAADLRQSAAGASPVLATVSAGQAVRVLEMRGDQARVDTGGEQGWMPVAKLRIGGGAAAQAAGAGGSPSWLHGLSGLLGGSASRQSGDAKVPIGVRGLQREDVANAVPDPGAVERLERYQVSPDQALAFALDAELESVDVAYPESGFSSAPAAGVASERVSGGGDR